MRYGDLRVLARMIDELDQTTPPGHSERVARLAYRCACEAGWSRRRCEKMRQAAVVHDVGKVLIPRRVLESARPLARQDWYVVRAHPKLGAELAAAAMMDDEQVQWVCEHHERPDRFGYPHGVAPCEGAQLLAASDSFDVMRRGRRYQAGRPLADVLTEFERLVGAQFTRLAVDALSRVVVRH